MLGAQNANAPMLGAVRIVSGGFAKPGIAPPIVVFVMAPFAGARR